MRRRSEPGRALLADASAEDTELPPASREAGGLARYEEGDFTVRSELDDAESRRLIAQLARPAIAFFTREFGFALPRRFTLTLLRGSRRLELEVQALGQVLPPHVKGLTISTATRTDSLVDLSGGQGGIVHELAHAFADTGVPAVPRWFSGGLAQLYEGRDQSGDPSLLDGGTGLAGLVTFRTRAARTALEFEPDWTLAQLTAQPAEDTGLASSLLLYLKHEGLLRGYVRALRKRDVGRDPLGLATLLALRRPAEPTRDAGQGRELEARWRAFVLGLSLDAP